MSPAVHARRRTPAIDVRDRHVIFFGPVFVPLTKRLTGPVGFTIVGLAGGVFVEGAGAGCDFLSAMLTSGVVLVLEAPASVQAARPL